MSIYSTQLYAGALGTVGNLIYTAPVGTTVVVRDVEFYNGTGGVSTLNINLDVSGTFAGVAAWSNNVPAGGFAQWSGRVVMNAGNTLLSGVTNAGCNVVVSGYVLS